MAIRERDFNSRLKKITDPIDNILIDMDQLTVNNENDLDILNTIRLQLLSVKDLQSSLIFENMSLKEEIKRNKKLASKIIGL